MKVIFSNDNRVIPLAKWFRERGDEVQTIHSDFKKVLTDADVSEIVCVGDVTNDEVSKRALLYCVDVLKSYETSSTKQTIGGKRLSFMMREVGAYIYRQLIDLAVIVSSLDVMKPDLMILHNDVEPHLRAAALWAKERGVPCLHIPHAIYMDTGRGAPGTDIHDLITASHMVTAGPYQTEWYTNRGMPIENLRETGLPQFENKNVMPRERARQLLKLNPRLPTITYASSWRQDTNLLGCHEGVEETYFSFIQAVAKMNGVQVIVKGHPSARNLQWHIDTAKQFDVQVVATAVHLPVVLSATDLLISYGPSNVLVDAALMGVPKLIATHGFESDPDIFKIGEDPTPQKFAEAIRAVVSNNPISYERFLYKYVGNNRDGKNMDRIKEYIDEICQT